MTLTILGIYIQIGKPDIKPILNQILQPDNYIKTQQLFDDIVNIAKKHTTKDHPTLAANLVNKLFFAFTPANIKTREYIKNTMQNELDSIYYESK